MLLVPISEQEIVRYVRLVLIGGNHEIVEEMPLIGRVPPNLGPVVPFGIFIDVTRSFCDGN